MILPQDMFIMTDYEKGLSEEDVERAIEILSELPTHSKADGLGFGLLR